MDEQLTKREVEELNKLAELGWRYYIREQSQKEIAVAMGITQPEVSTGLKNAKEKGIIKITVHPYFTEDLREKILGRFPHLQEVLIAPFVESERNGAGMFSQGMGDMAARFLLGNLHHGARIGVSCGQTVGSVIDSVGALTQQDVNMPVACKVYALLTLMTSDVVAVTPAALAMNLVRWLPDASGKAFQLPLPYKGVKEHPRARDAYEDNPEIKSLLSDLKDLDFYLTGIGVVDYHQRRMVQQRRGDPPTYDFNSVVARLDLQPAFEKYHVECEYLYQPLDNDGNILMAKEEFKPLRENLFYLPLDILQKHVQKDSAIVLAVAGGEVKHRPVYAALHAKAFNVLATDVMTAAYILQEEGILDEGEIDENTEGKKK